MARKLDAPCMFCGGNPCICDGGKTKKSSPRTRKASSPVEKSTIETSQPSTRSDSDIEDVFGEIPEAKQKFKSVSHSEDRDLSLESALRILRPLVSDKSRREIDRTLNRKYPQELDKRVARWRNREA